MKITGIEVFPLTLSISEVYGGAAGFLEDCRTLIVRVETGDGIEGSTKNIARINLKIVRRILKDPGSPETLFKKKSIFRSYGHVLLQGAEKARAD